MELHQSLFLKSVITLPKLKEKSDVRRLAPQPSVCREALCPQEHGSICIEPLLLLLPPTLISLSVQSPPAHWSQLLLKEGWLHSFHGPVCDITA